MAIIFLHTSQTAGFLFDGTDLEDVRWVKRKISHPHKKA
jgi:hypothetical protein